MGKINASIEIMFESPEEKIKYILHKSPSKRSFAHRSDSFPRWTDARGSADIIYCI